MPQLIHPDKKNWIYTGDKEINDLFDTLSTDEEAYLTLITQASRERVVGV